MVKVSSLPADDQTCGWYHLSKKRTVRPSHTGTSQARWVIVGAGYTGLAAARQLAEHFPNEEIVLVEAQEVGFGTAGRNAGFAIDLPHDNRILVRNSFSFNPDGRSNKKYLDRFVVRHRESFKRRFPMLPDVDFDYTWGGSLAISRNHQGFFGKLAPNVYGALCCNGLGITRGTVTGKLLADWLAGDHNDMMDALLASPGPNKNPPEPFLSMGVNANLWWNQQRAGLES